MHIIGIISLLNYFLSFLSNNLIEYLNFNTYESINYDIHLNHNLSDNTVVLYLFSDGVKSDSIKLSEVNLGNDNLTNINNIWWHYTFTECNPCFPAGEYTDQLILKPVNKKLQICLFADYRWYQQITNANLKEKNLKLNSDTISWIKNQYEFYCSLKLDKNFFNGDYVLHLFMYVHNDFDSLIRKGMKKDYKLEYDSVKNIFYNKKEIFNGICTFRTVQYKDGYKRNLNNESILMIQLSNDRRSSYAYFEGSWYSVLGHSFTAMDWLSVCPNGCKE
jgi:hypothetical protein